MERMMSPIRRVSSSLLALCLVTTTQLPPGDCAGPAADAYSTAGECASDSGRTPRVTLQCPSNHMIHVRRSFHGSRASTGSRCGRHDLDSNCTYCPGDCIDETAGVVYDWTTCTGQQQCSRTVLQSLMPHCSRGQQAVTMSTDETPAETSSESKTNVVTAHSATWEHFSDYINVDYDCINRSEVTEMCEETSRIVQSGHLVTPQYPAVYPTNVNCLCRLQADRPAARLRLTFYDLALETRHGRCQADWIMLRQKDGRHRHCGAILQGTKGVTSSHHVIEIQFHSDKNDNITQSFRHSARLLKGVWLQFASVPAGTNVRVTCRRLRDDEPEVMEINRDDAGIFADAVTPPLQTRGADGEDQNASRERLFWTVSGASSALHTTLLIGELLSHSFMVMGLKYICSL